MENSKQLTDSLGRAVSGSRCSAYVCLCETASDGRSPDLDSVGPLSSDVDCRLTVEEVPKVWSCQAVTTQHYSCLEKIVLWSK